MADEKTVPDFSNAKAASGDPLTKQEAMEAMTAIAEKSLKENKVNPAHNEAGIAGIAKESVKSHNNRYLRFQCDCACPKASDVLVSVVSSIDTAGISINITQPNI